MTEPDGRTRHYGEFYGLRPLPGESGSEPSGDGPEPSSDGAATNGDGLRIAVFGNCQAEALRVSLATAGTVRSVRMPPVHELTEEDLPHLDRVLRWVDVLAAQAVGDGYRGLPLGTREVAGRMGAEARLVRIPNYFSTVLYPEQVLVRHADPAVVDPPVVPYHDVRRLGAAAGWAGPWEAPAEAVRAGAEASLAELERREAEQDSLVISDVVREVGAQAGWTVDHPGNPVLLALAQRVLEASGAGGEVADPGRVLLPEVRTPLRVEVLDALGLDGAAARETWTVRGEELTDEEVGAAHEEFYAAHPRVVEVGVAKKEDVLRGMGWRP